MKIINLISGPRNLSTALMYSFAQRGDCQVLDEPFYGHYLHHARPAIRHPFQEEIIMTMELDEASVVRGIELLALRTHVFVKGMAHHYISDSPDFILNWENVILIRHPEKLISSFSKVIEAPSLEDIGLKKAAQLFSWLHEKGKPPLVIDSDELMLNPERYLRKVCEALQLPFSESMLKWEEGGIPQDGIWGPHWYGNVHRSTGFRVQQNESIALPDHLRSLLAKALPHYETLRKHILLNN
ncbi:MAG: hypothetical protein CMC08_04420 [Flavobacteriaceae bacterium]|nr:hypothetical protein [Flavobacteriaceae bacterium]